MRPKFGANVPGTSDNRSQHWNFSTLPPEAQKVVAELITFLGKQNQRLRPTPKAKAVPIAEEKFIGIWQNREDMHDSNAYVRNLRQHDWA